jgi:hypothetical protein
MWSFYNREIQAKSRAIWESTPDQLRYDRRPNDHSYDGWLTIVYFYLDYLMTCFLLYRAVVKHTNTGQADLCDVSRRILAIVIQIHSFRTPMVDLDRHFSWIVCRPRLPFMKETHLLIDAGSHIRCSFRQRPSP